jgi:hypothetical protein
VEAESKLWVLSLEAGGVMAVVRVNDVTICEKRFNTPTSFGEKLNPLLMAARTVSPFSLGLPPAPRVAPRPPAPGRFAPDPPPMPSFSMRVQRGTQG